MLSLGLTTPGGVCLTLDNQLLCTNSPQSLKIGFSLIKTTKLHMKVSNKGIVNNSTKFCKPIKVLAKIQTIFDV